MATKAIPERQRVVLECAAALREKESLRVRGHDLRAAWRLQARGLGTLLDGGLASARGERFSFAINNAGRSVLSAEGEKGEG